MATVATPADQTTEILQKLSLDPQAKALEIPEPAKKTSVYQYGSVDGSNVPNGQAPSYERSTTPLLPEFIDPAMFYYPNGYPSAAYFYGAFNGTGNEGYDNLNYMNPEDLTYGVYGDNAALMYHTGYGYASFAPYSPASTPVPTMGNDSQLYGPQQYQYPSYFPSSTPTSGAFAPTASVSQGVSSANTAEQKSLPVEGVNAAAVVTNNGAVNVSNGSNTAKPAHQKGSFSASTNSYGRGALTGGFEGYQTRNPWQNGSTVSDLQNKPVSNSSIASSFSKANNVSSARNPNYRSNSHYTGLQHPATMPGISTHGYINRMYPTKLYGQYGNSVRSSMGYGSHGYDMRAYGKGYFPVDSKYKPRGRGNNYFYGNENMDGLNELNRGPRAKGTKNQKSLVPVTVTVKGQNEASNVIESEKIVTCEVPDRQQYNKEDFPEDYVDARFFVIKSYSEDDVHKSIKYNVWASTPNGNKKLDQAYQEAQQRSGGFPIFLLFSVNTSGQFVGLAEMVGPVDFNKNVEYWQQDKWTGSFPVKWHIVKDVPNSLLKHIILENNENKPVTNSRDTQEVHLEKGLKIIRIFKTHSSRTCILDDFEFYEARQKTILEKKAKQQLQKQAWEGKPVDERRELANGSLKLAEPVTELTEDPISTDKNNENAKVSETGSVQKSGDVVNSVKPDGVAEKTILANGIANGC